MSDWLDRKAFCKRAGIHPRTLSRWVREGIVRPTTRGARGQGLFTREEVAFGAALSAMLKRYPGRYTLREMADLIREGQELDPHHSPPGSPNKK